MAENAEGGKEVVNPSSADELALLVEEVEDYAMFLLTPAGNIASWNAGARRIMGYEPHEAIGRHFSILYPPDEEGQAKPHLELAVAEREGRIEDEGWRIRSNGERFWANTIITALRDEAGSLRGFAKITRDLTKRRDDEERLRHSEEMFRLLIDSVQDYAIYMIDTDGNVVSWNAGAHRIKQYDADEIIGRPFAIFYTEEDQRAGLPQRNLGLARDNGRTQGEGWRVRKDGSRFWASVVITAVHDEHGVLRGFAKVTRDITDQKRAEETKRALMDQQKARLQAEEERQRAESSFRVAQEANRAKDEFLMTLSHELRTPMTSILGWARLLPTMSPNDANFQEAIDAIARGAQLQARLIDDVLDVSRIVSGKLRLTRETVEAGRAISGAVDAIRPTADAKSITLSTSLSPGLGTIVVDSTRLQQVLWNLLSNAVKFTPRGGSVEVSARRSSSHLQISVTDSGEGIEPGFLPHVFEPFRQAENPNTRIHGGLGLGLSIVRYIVEAHGGTVGADSAGRGRGATFTVTLPIGAVAPAVEPGMPGPLRAGRALDGERLRGMKILVVDDDRGSREMVCAILTQSGAAVTSADSAATGLAHLQDDRPDLVISDLAMPNMDGYEFVRQLRARPDGAKLKVVALSAFPAGMGGRDRSGFDAYLTKPIDPFVLVDELVRITGPTSSLTA